MKRKTASVVYLLLAIIIAAGLLAGCNGQNSEPKPEAPVTPPEQPAEAPETPQATEPPATVNGVDRVEVVYFHRPQRCTKCLCFEERVTHVIETYFQEEIDSGMITFKVIDLADAGEADAIRKYNAVASQLFINTVIDGTDHIRDVREIWDWGCTTDPEGFDEAVRNFITLSLAGELE